MSGPSSSHPIDPVDVCALGARSGLLWRSAELTLAGLGRAHFAEVALPSATAAATELLRSLAGTKTEADASPGRGPVGFVTLPFERDRAGEMIVPEIVVGTDGAETWLTTIGDIDTNTAQARVAETLHRPVPSGEQPTSFEMTSVLAPEVWRDDVVAVARDRIQAGEMTKAVLARELTLTTDQPFDSALIVDRLAARFPTAMIFSVDGFVAASPELLVSRIGNVVQAHPLAGTAPRSSDPETDADLAATLLASTKDQGEHRITIDWFLNELLPFCSYVDAEPEPTIVTMANVHHLGTAVEGVLSSPAASVLELAAALHPTPAVGGDPQAAAMALIDELEQADRGRYAGPTGWVDANGNGALAVSVRSAQIGTEDEPCTTRLFAGVGVVAASDPAAELAETRAKFQAMLGALLQP